MSALWCILLLLRIHLAFCSKKSYYSILGIDKMSADEKAIKRAYRKLAMKHHPDRGGDENKFKEVSTAYEVLSDKKKKELYDAYGEAGVNPQAAPQPGQRYSFGSGGRGTSGGAPEDFFEQLRRAQAGGGGNGAGSTFFFDTSGGMDDMLRQMFGGGGLGGGGGSPFGGFGGAGGGGWGQPRSRAQHRGAQSEVKQRQRILRYKGDEYVKATKLHNQISRKKVDVAAVLKSKFDKNFVIQKDISVSLEDLHFGVEKRFRVKDSLTILDENTQETLKHPLETIVSVEIKAGYRSGTRLTFPPSQSFPRIIIFTLKDAQKHPVFGVVSEMTPAKAESVTLPGAEWRDRPGLLFLRRVVTVRSGDVAKGKSFDVPTIDGNSREVAIDPAKAQDIIRAGPGHSKEVHLLVKAAGLTLSSKERKVTSKTRGDLLITVNIIS